MKRALRILMVAAVACIVVGVTAALVSPREREPEYQGKKLSEWAMVYCYGGPTERNAAKDAVEHLGVRAVPWLVGWIEGERFSGPERVLLSALKRSPPGVRQLLEDRLQRFWLGRVRRGIFSGEVFHCVGVDGAEAVPDLIRIITRPVVTNDFFWQFKVRNTRWALEGLGRQGVPGLKQALEDPQQPNRAVVVGILGEVRHSADLVVPLLEHALEDRELSVRIAATNVLREIAPHVLEEDHERVEAGNEKIPSP